jgi:quercetin dioxygenase-like cupin family protein
MSDPPVHRKAKNYRWEGVAVEPYKEDTRALFKSVTRQVLFSDPGQESELRYFEIAPGGFSSLERHRHTHNVLVLRGIGHCLIGHEVQAVTAHDLVAIPPLTWHQFRATGDEPLGFLCMVNTRRDKPELPTPHDLAELQQDSRVAAFLRDFR